MFTNGLRKDQVLTELVGRLGWMPQAGVTEANSGSISGRRFEDFHPVVNIPVLKAVMDPVVDDAAFNTRILDLQKAVILKSLTGVFREPEYIERQVMFHRCVENNDREIPGNGSFVGVRIRVAQDSDLAVKIETVSLYFTEAGDFTLYLYQAGKIAPLKTKLVSVNAGEQTIISLADWILSGSGEGLTGVYYLGYYQGDLAPTNRAIQESYLGVNQFKTVYAEFMEADTFGVDFDRESVTVSSVNYGINLVIAAFKDWTYQVIRKAELFDELIGWGMAAEVIERIIYSTRSNVMERVATEAVAKLYDELNLAKSTDEVPQMVGIKKRMEEEFNRVRRSFFPKKRIQIISL